MSRLRGICAIVAGGLALLTMAAIFMGAKPVSAAASGAAGVPLGNSAVLGPEMALAAVVGVGGLLYLLRPRRHV
jgi:hypothetical protein